MSQNIKNNLFRFVTLRNPQLIEEKDKQLGFVYHPDETTGTFYTPLRAASSGGEKQALLDARDSFASSNFKTKKDVKGVNADLYNFSAWLMRNKNALSYAAILDNINSAQVLTSQEEMTVWDNLIYQTISRQSVYVREALIQVLIANKFLAHFNTFSTGLTGVITFTEDQEKTFKRLANASVVISKEMLLETYNDDNLVSTKPKAVNTENEKRLNDLLTAKYDKLALKNLTKELKDLQKLYIAQEAADYQTALDDHQKDVDVILDAGSVQLVNKWDVEDQANIQVEKFVHDPLPKFNYTKAVEIDATALQAKLSSISYKYLTDYKLATLPSYDAILKAVKRLSKESSGKIDQLMPKAGKSVLKGGVNMRLEDPFKTTLDDFGDVDTFVEDLIDAGMDNSKISGFAPLGLRSKDVKDDACYMLRLVASAGPDDTNGDRKWLLSLRFTNHDEPVTIDSITHSVTFTNDSTVFNSSSIFVSASDSSYKISLFNDMPSIQMGSTVGLPILSGTINLSNGRSIDFSETISMQPNAYKGLFGSVVLNFDCTEDVPSEESPSTFGKLYGVTNLGIADFRRVEQEVCCYVPGEVSHIENVMAREYKERSTRSLTSSEFTTETSEERERENLTDTTSTERNEMQSEVATVLNEDQSQSYGGNANVSSEFGDTVFNAGAFFDSASSSSSSDSNTHAQTYAQEVTERAMERIVQKTQTKRTSRILKEFEENTSHGFDNRKGEKHVTGVYRWVDKIYKNTLINYGKRLMYEFAIPEPSKFFQEAVWKELNETGQVGNGIILPELPVHPKDIGMTSASVLGDEDLSPNIKDYRKIAARYNAEVNAIPKEELIVGSSKSFTTGTKYEALSLDGEVEIPEGYKGVASAFAFGAQEVGDSDDSTIASLAVGDIFINAHNNHGRLYMNHTSSYSTAPNYNSNPNEYTDFKGDFSGSVPYSASVHNAFTGNITVSVKCQRTDEAYDQWQNQTYNAIMEAYYDRLQEYNDAMREKEANEGLTPEAERLTFNPLQNKSIMLRELKRVAIELMIDQNKVSKDNYNLTVEATGVAAVKKTEAFQTHASTVKFFEQAFDWDIMAYVFYPYFYANEKDWKKLFQSQDVADPLFQAFLQSGMARTVVPVRAGFEDAVNWYMTTGEIWNGQGLVVDQEDDLYVSIAEEMETVDGTIEGTWETRLPTALTILQAGSIGLKVEGLPCNLECDDHLLFDTDGNPVLDENGKHVTQNPIEQTDTLIGGEQGPGGVGSDSVGEVITVQ